MIVHVGLALMFVLEVLMGVVGVRHGGMVVRVLVA